MTRRIFKGQHIKSSNTEVLHDGTLAVDLDTNYLYLHDGITPGGNKIVPSNVLSSNFPAAGAINVDKQVASLAPGSYTLADGVEGQVLFLTVKSGNRQLVQVTFDNIRYNASDNIQTNTMITPFWGSSTSNRPTVVTCIFTNGAWTIDNTM